MWLLAREWRSDYCEYHRHLGQVRIRVDLWLRLAAVRDSYFVPPRTARKVFDYLRMHGVVQTVQKIRSRLAESERNRKYVVLGSGEILEADPQSLFSPGESVLFFAPQHPACVSELAVDEGLVLRWPETVVSKRLQESEAVLHGSAEALSGPWNELAGWSDFSGQELDPDLVKQCFEAGLTLLSSDEIGARLTPLSCRQEFEPRKSKRAEAVGEPGKPNAVLFGLGHHAKSVILPRLSDFVEVTCVHEIDPAQLGPVNGLAADLRTSAYLEEDERYDVYIIAGYHHTHAPIALRALEEGAVAVVEKPLVTTRGQLDSLVAAMAGERGRIYAAFQRRYSVFNNYLREDLRLGDTIPVHCQAVVYEVPLPNNHWYRWPCSRSLLVSNGCHWIDHFLFLNRFAKPASIRALIQANGNMVVAMDLENGASFSMTLTEHGSPRLGVRDSVHFQAGQCAATIVDQRHYYAESGERPLRRSRISTRDPYDRMYKAIGQRIASGEPGDSIESVQVSMEAMLTADEQVFGG